MRTGSDAKLDQKQLLKEELTTPVKINRKPTLLMGTQECSSATFDPDEYEKEKYVEIFEMHSDIQSKLSEPVLEILEKEGHFKFKLQEYPGRDNPASLIVYDPDHIIFYGQTRQVGENKAIKEGKGYLYKNKNIYSGYFRDDKFDGPGSFILSDTQVCYYFGFWSADNLKGKGQLNMDNGYHYHGEFLDGLQEGYGEEIWPDGSLYKGGFKKGLKEGEGECTWLGKARYKGHFKEGLFEGHGVFEWQQGNKYEGQWKANLIEGKGKFTWEDGRVYEGSYVAGKREGFGILTYPNHSRWEGQWKAGKRIGEGKHYSAEGERLESQNSPSKRLSK